MQKLLLTLSPAARIYKIHAATLAEIALQIAYFNWNDDRYPDPVFFIDHLTKAHTHLKFTVEDVFKYNIYSHKTAGTIFHGSIHIINKIA